VPLTNLSGTSSVYTNPYNGSHQYSFATKHDGQLYFNATNGGNNSTPSNPEVRHYAPLQQLQRDLVNNTVGRYNWISPDLYNDMHSALNDGFIYNGVHYFGSQSAIATTSSPRSFPKSRRHEHTRTMALSSSGRMRRKVRTRMIFAIQ
jgi:hypothetical protein